MTNKEFQNFASNLKKTDFGIKFGKKLFSSPQSLTPKQITLALKQLGINVPKEVIITADLAQAITTGQATMVAIDSGKNINQITQLSAQSINLYTQLANDLGWVDDESAAFVSIGADLALICASAGANVQAWIGLAIDLMNVSQINSMDAKKLATNALVDWYSTEIKTQSQSMAKNFLEYQKGSIGIFGLLASTADESPFLFENNIKNNPQLQKILPGLNFIPVVNYEKVFEAYSKNFIGQVANESARVTVRTIGEMNQKEAANFIFSWVIEPFTICYLEAEKFYTSKKLPSIFNLSLLWALDTSGNIKYINENNGGQISRAFVRNQLTPSDLYIENFFDSYYPETTTYGISGALGNKFKKEEPTRDQIFNADINGDIENLFNFPKTRKILDTKTSYPLIPPNDSVPWQESSYKSYSVRGTSQTYTEQVRDLKSWYGGSATDWRKLQNFIACLDYLDLVRNDPYYKSLNISLDSVEKYNVFPKLQDWKDRLSEVQALSTMRKTNKLALTNVAYFLGANDPSRIKLKNTLPNGATIWE